MGMRTAGGTAWFARALLSALLGLSASLSFAATAHGAPPRNERLHAFLQRHTGSDGYLGAVMLVARDGRIVDQGAFGHADLARRRPMRRDAIFRIYSMTKPITSVAVLMLMEEGRLSLDDPVSRYLPEFANLRRFTGGTADAPVLAPPATPLTLRHLLTHASGFAVDAGRNPEAARLFERADLHDSASLAEFTRKLATVPLADEPGTHFAYDGANTETLARVIEVVSEKPFPVFVQERILGPLRMRDTGFSVPAAKRDRVVDLSTMADDGRLALADTASARTPGVMLQPYPSAAGGLYSTIGDYFRFAQMLANDGRLGDVRLLSRKTVDLMMSDQLGKYDPPLQGFIRGEGFGLGGYVVTDVAMRGRLGSVGQFGWSGAASTYFTVDRKERLVAILMMNHLPRDNPPAGVHDLPRISVPFYNLVYQALP